MRRDTLIALAVVTLLAAAAALFAPSGQGSGPAPVPSPTPVFPGLGAKLGSAVKLTVTTATGAVALERHGAAGSTAAEHWILPAKGGYPVSTAAIKPILDWLVSAKQVAPKTGQPKLYSRLDLDDPGKDKESQSTEVQLDPDNGAALAKLVVGKQKFDAAGQGDNGIYIRKPGDPQTWLAEPAITFPVGETGWIDTKVLDIDPASLQSVVLTPANGVGAITVSRDKKGDPLAVKDLPKDAKLKDESEADTIAGSFQGLNLEDVKPAGDATGAPAGKAHFATLDGLSGDLALVKRDDGVWATVTATGASGDAAKQAADITGRTTGWAYKLPEATVTTLQSRLADIVQPPAAPPAKADAGKNRTEK